MNPRHAALAKSLQLAAEQRKKLAKRRQIDRASAARSALVAQTADGLAPQKRALLHAAARKMRDDPAAKALLEKAELQRRVRDARKAAGIPAAVVSLLATKPLEESELPPSVGQRRSKKRG